MILYFYLSLGVMFVSACEQHQTCRGCIRDFRACVWCLNDNNNGSKCIPETSISEHWCMEIINPKSEKKEIPHQVGLSPNSEEIIQISPQRIKMKLRPGEAVYFNFSYTAAEHYPVDLYFLFDLSIDQKSRDTYVEQTIQVAEWTKTVTNNASIGFGTFIDKNALPFTSIKDNTTAYSFSHRFSISRDRKGFKTAINEIQVANTTFNDNPNGGFDALAQVIACKEIGWRPVSRKIVVFFSNSVYHAAGDGSAAGIINPYDGQCYMKNGVYTKELEMDYPTTGIINKMTSERAVTIIFVIDVVNSVYVFLKNVINGAQVIYPRQTNSNMETVATKLTKTYEAENEHAEAKNGRCRPTINVTNLDVACIEETISVSITKIIKPNKYIDSRYANKINISFIPDCDHTKCEVGQNKRQEFVGKIKVLEYFEAEEVKVNISITGIKEKLTLDIKLINECNCKPGNNVLCNGGGIRRCGICECDPNRSGLHCECSSTNLEANKNKSNCMEPNSEIECRGRGSCSCGVCACEEKRYRGQYCECDDENCPSDDNGRLCGHGTCLCGECKCEEGWLKNSKKTCNCDNSKDRCKTGDHECSGYGKCECNECKCPANICAWDARSSQGRYCNPLPCDDCHKRQCNLLEPYAVSHKNNTMCDRRVNVTSTKVLDDESTWMLCSDIRYDVGCYTKFIYKYDDEFYGVHVIVQSEHNCESAYIYGGICLGALIFIGILTLLGWKLLTVYRDRKEYKRFMTQYKENLAISSPLYNPLFSSPTITITNPNFRKRSVFLNNGH